MNIASLTMVHKNYWQFRQWVRCNERTVGRQNCFIVVHGPDPIIEEAAQGCNLIQIPRSDKSLGQFDQDRMAALDGLRDSLLYAYDAVIQSDSDELVFSVTQPLTEVIDRHKDLPAIAALGFELVERKNDMQMHDGGLFEQRRGAVFTGHYSKACVVFRKGVQIRKHGYIHRSVRRGVHGFTLEPDLFLGHIRYANLNETASADEARLSFEQSGIKAPNGSWRNPDDGMAKFFKRYMRRKKGSFVQAYTQAVETLSKGEIVRKYSLAVAQKKIMDYRFTLPDSFEDVC